jgi:hypothetical protein
MRRTGGTIVFAWLLITSAGSHAWGLEGHRSITSRAVDGLPADLRRAFAPHRDFLSEHAIDPDLWRLLDLRGALGTEDPNHFLNLDALGEPPPFTNVPRDRTMFIARYGRQQADRAGRLPWQAADLYARLVEALEAAGSARDGSRDLHVRFFAAVLAHYVEDAFVPFHAVRNHDGQQTGQNGIHARFETDLPARFGAQIRLAPVAPRRIPEVTEFMFQTLAESAQLAGPVLDADRMARGGRRQYDRSYYDRFFAEVRPVIERRMGEAASAVASLILSAWEDAGRPQLVRR